MFAWPALEWSVSSSGRLKAAEKGLRICSHSTVTAAVVPGCIVLPGTSDGVAAATLVERGHPLHVRLEAAEGFTDVSRPTPQNPAVQAPGDTTEER